MTDKQVYSTICKMVMEFQEITETGEFAKSVIKAPQNFVGANIPFYSDAAALLLNFAEKAGEVNGI